MAAQAAWPGKIITPKTLNLSSQLAGASAHIIHHKHAWNGVTETSFRARPMRDVIRSLKEDFGENEAGKERESHSKRRYLLGILKAGAGRITAIGRGAVGSKIAWWESPVAPQSQYVKKYIVDYGFSITGMCRQWICRMKQHYDLRNRWSLKIENIMPQWSESLPGGPAAVMRRRCSRKAWGRSRASQTFNGNWDVDAKFEKKTID